MDPIEDRVGVGGSVRIRICCERFGDSADPPLVLIMGLGRQLIARQLAAVITSGDRTAELETITAPTLVIHGDRDRVVHASGGRATADAIPGARLVTIAGMGHDLPPPDPPARRADLRSRGPRGRGSRRRTHLARAQSDG